jgi:hypothetical protein
MDNIVIDASILNVVTTIATVVIAVTAVAFGICQSLAARKHNRLSVRPLLVTEVNCDPTMRGFGVSVANKGVGPAIVTDFRVLVDGQDETASLPNLWQQALRTLDLNYSFLQHFSLQKGAAISPGECLPLITAEPNEIDEEMRLHMKKLLPRIGCVISYKSVYNESFKEKHEGVPELLKDEKWMQT